MSRRVLMKDLNSTIRTKNTNAVVVNLLPSKIPLDIPSKSYYNALNAFRNVVVECITRFMLITKCSKNK
jgi:hypothetical protein